MSDVSREPVGEKPASEPEIIPPPRKGAGPHFSAETWSLFAGDGVYRIHVSRLGPLGWVSLILGASLFVAVVLILLAGALLLGVPVLVLLGAGAVVGALVRRSIGQRR